MTPETMTEQQSDQPKPSSEHKSVKKGVEGEAKPSTAFQQGYQAALASLDTVQP